VFDVHADVQGRGSVFPARAMTSTQVIKGTIATIAQKAMKNNVERAK